MGSAGRRTDATFDSASNTSTISPTRSIRLGGLLASVSTILLRAS